jgi:fatty-acid desaturase
VLVLIDPVLLTMYAAAYAIDFARLGLVNWFCHRGGYRNFDTKDQSTNNLVLGWLGMGFGWHNNHHANPGKLILTEKWWELDVEGYIGWMLGKTAKQ